LKNSQPFPVGQRRFEDDYVRLGLYGLGQSDCAILRFKDPVAMRFEHRAQETTNRPVLVDD